MEMTDLTICVDEEIKAQAEQVFTELGMDMTTAVNVFLKGAIRKKGIPFELKLDLPNDTTEAAIEE